MTDQQFVDICTRVCRDAQGKLPPTLRSRLKLDTERRKDKSPKVMLFSVRDKDRRGLWNGYYTTYALVHNPFNDVDGIWHCRFMHHKKRKETGSGRFNGGVEQLVRRYNGQGGFHLEHSDEVFNLTQPFKGTESGLESKLAHALAFLIGHLHPKIDEIIAGTDTSGLIDDKEEHTGTLSANASEHQPARSRRYWVVSPNVKNDDSTVEAWCEASIREEGAFMGWAPTDEDHGAMGPKFAGRTDRGVMPGDVILIARRHYGEPNVVGFGIVKGNALLRLKNFASPKGLPFGSFRRLAPFVPWSRIPPGVPLKETVNFAMAMVQLHPDERPTHRKVCDWMDRHLGKASALTVDVATSPKDEENTRKTTLIDLPGSYQLDFKIQTREQVINARAVEAQLLNAYREWLKRQGRKLVAAKYGGLCCDGYERETGNLIEAKQSTRREHIRIAVGQLLDYAFMGKENLGEPHKAILLPSKPDAGIEDWLRSLDISIVWQEQGKFRDNNDRRFT